MNIIAIDDEMDALHLFLDQIISVEKNVGYKFFKDDEESVLSYVKNNHVDGAFIDVNLPRIGDMGGLLLLRKILKISPSTKAIMVTGTSLAMEDIPNDISGSVLGIIYKPISTMKLQEYILNLGGLSSTMKVKTFGQFDCFVNDHLVNFSSSKSKELFALLIALNGKSLTMEHAITLLWPDRPIDQAKIIYRDAVWRLRASLKEVDFPCVNFQRALLILDKTNIQCDYWDLLEGKEVNYGGEFLSSYEWSLPFESEINDLIEKNL